MFDDGNTGNSNAFGQNATPGFTSFPPPPPPRRDSKLWIIPVAIIGTIAVTAAIAFSVWTINLTQQSEQQRNGASQEKLTPSDTDFSDNSSGDPELDDLNIAGSVAWSPDQFDYLFGDPPRSVYVSDVGSGGGSCALLLYEDYIVALGAERDAFNYYVTRQGNAPIVVQQGAAGGTGNGLGYVLLADSQETECAVQAFDYLG